MLVVTVTLDDAIPALAQSAALLAFELHLRQLTKLDCRVMKNKMGDDSKLRMALTPEERERV